MLVGIVLKLRRGYFNGKKNINTLSIIANESEKSFSLSNSLRVII